MAELTVKDPNHSVRIPDARSQEAGTPFPASEDFFRFDSSPPSLQDLDTPIPVIDLDVVERNLVRWQSFCDQSGLANRPHVKTHKMIPLAKIQLALGARGITVQKLGEAEVMADAGIRDILVTYNIVGKPKLDRLAALRSKCDLSVVADNAVVVEGLSQAGQQGEGVIHVLVECDTGGRRNGVQTPADALALARLIRSSPGLRFAGLMTFPAVGGRQEMSKFLADACSLLAGDGLESPIVTAGGTPGMWSMEGLGSVTEYRAGTYIYNDRMTMASGACLKEDCAVSIMSTVVSCPSPERVVLDAGSKALTSERIGPRGFGELRDEGAIVFGQSEEHGLVDTRDTSVAFKVGMTVRVIPNHVCPTINLFDRVCVARGANVVGIARVDARGKVA